MKNKKEKGIIVLLLMFAVFMTVGFAEYSSTLNVEGEVGVKSSKWKVSYVTGSYEEESGSVSAAEHDITETDFTFKASLTKPGDYYQASFTVKNTGTFDAVLNKIQMSSLSDAQQKYLTYTIKYGDQEYTSTTDELSVELDESASETVIVRVEYVAPEQSTDLPQTDTTVTITGNLIYGLAE